MVGGSLWGALKLIVGPHVKKVEQLDDDVAKLKQNTVTTVQLKEAETTIIGAVREMKDDMVTRIGAVQRAADAAHERLDRQNEAELARLRAASGQK